MVPVGSGVLDQVVLVLLATPGASVPKKGRFEAREG